MIAQSADGTENAHYPSARLNCLCTLLNCYDATVSAEIADAFRKGSSSGDTFG
jgi:hypothetical protein